MVTNYNDTPCVVEWNSQFFKVAKPQKFFYKHREMDDDTVKISYVTNPDRQIIDKQLQKLEDSLRGIVRERENPDEHHFLYEYRLNCNTVLCASTLEDFNRIKKEYGIQIDETGV